MVRYLARVNELIIYDWKFNGGWAGLGKEGRAGFMPAL